MWATTSADGWSTGSPEPHSPQRGPASATRQVAQGATPPLQGHRGDGCGPLPALAQHGLQAGRVASPFAVALLHGPQGLHGGLGQQGLEGTPAQGGAVAGRLLPAQAGQKRVEAQEVVLLFYCFVISFRSLVYAASCAYIVVHFITMFYFDTNTN